MAQFMMFQLVVVFVLLQRQYLFRQRARKPEGQKGKQGCVMGVGMCLYAQLVQTKNN